jgi:hypothetical protein
MASYPQPSPVFARRPFPRGEVTLIESKCKLCGFRIVGSVTESLAQDEADHLARCPGVQAKAG